MRAADSVPSEASLSSARIAAWVFVALEASALVIFAVMGRRMWFARPDEWDFLAGRSLGLHDLLRPHGGHLVVLPVVVFRALFFAFGLRSYLPYQLVVIGFHLAAAALLRIAMGRAGARPFVATAVAAAFLFFGPGGENILLAFQITFVGALVFGLTQLLLADHDGPIDRRDWLGLTAGLLALCCSGVGIATVGAAGVAALIRRGWRPAAFHVLPLVAVIGVWRHFNADSTVTADWSIVTWVRHGVEASFNSLGSIRFVGWALGAVFVVGLASAFFVLQPDERRRRAALPVSFLAGALFFLVLTGVSRLQFGATAVNQSRYLYIVVAMILVPLAVAVDALVSRRRSLGLVAAALVLVGIPSNLTKTTNSFPPASFYARYRQQILSLPRSELARGAPRSLHPDPNLAPQVTVGWLLDAARSGRLPKPRSSTPIEAATNNLRLTVAEFGRDDGRRCAALTGPIRRTLRAGASLSVRGTVAIQLLARDGLPPSLPVTFGTTFHAAGERHTLVAVGRTSSLLITPKSPGAGVC